MQKQCQQILDILKNEQKTLEYLYESAKFIESEELNIDFNDRKSVERKDTTTLILDKLTEIYLVKKSD